MRDSRLYEIEQMNEFAKVLRDENLELRKHWDECIEIIRDFPLDHRLSDRAMTLYKQWIDANEKKAREILEAKP